MFRIFGKKKEAKRTPVTCARADHCISRKNIDPEALKVLYRLSHLGYTAYLVGGGVRDLLLGRRPKDFDVGTSARPEQVKRAFRNCYIVGRRFKLAHVTFGSRAHGFKVIETATFRQNSQTVGEIIEHAAEMMESAGSVKPFEDNTYGTPETDAYRRDFTVNGLFYDIKTFAVIDWVGGLRDLKKKVIRSIGDPMIRFREDPVRMMRAIKFSSRLGFTIERGTLKAIRQLHAGIVTASRPRLCEEIFRLFPYGASCPAFRMMWEYGLLGDLLPELAAFIDADGGRKSATWTYLEVLDRYEKAMAERGVEVSNGLRAACLYAAMARAHDGHAHEVVGTLSKAFNVPKTTYFTAVTLLESVKTLSVSPTEQKKKRKFVHNHDFPDALDFNRIVARAEGRDERILDEWDELSRQMRKKQGEKE
ncbi:MAG: polynucleotide adenylyltransferase PcnB [Kiritimatiellia bacterium]